MAGFAAVEAKDELIEIGLQMLATQPVVDASRPSFEVGEDLVDPRQDEVSGGLPDDMDIVAIGGDRPFLPAAARVSTASDTAFGALQHPMASPRPPNSALQSRPRACRLFAT